jgi:predicted phage gp36 major capsid-like protein
MANQVPLGTLTSAAGGALVAPDFVTEPLLQKINRRTSVLSLPSTVRQTNTQRTTYPIYMGRPTAGFVGEGSAKGVTGAEFGTLNVNVKKIATIVLYDDELIQDAFTDPTVLVNDDVAAAFEELIDQHALGMAAGSAIVGQFDAELTGTTNTTADLATTTDGLAVAVSSAMNLIESNGYDPNGIAMAFDLKQHMRDARGPGDNATVNPYTGQQGALGQPGESLYGMPIAWTTALDALPAGAGKIAAVVGDWSNAIFVIREDIKVSISHEATVDVSATLHHLWQQNKTAVRWEMRIGFNAHDLNRAFAIIPNAA